MYTLIVLVLFVSTTLVKTESSISKLPFVYGLENKDARFKWEYVGTYSKIEWRKGDTTGSLIMYCVTGCDTQSKSPSYNIDYLEGVNSVGMILHNVNGSFEGQYTVRIYIDGSPGPYTSSNLSVITSEQFNKFIQQSRLTINGQQIQSGTPVDIHNTGTISLSSQVPDTYAHHTKCIKVSADGIKTNLCDCTNATCKVNADVEDGDKIYVSVLIVGFDPSEEIGYNITIKAETATTFLPETPFVRSATDVLTFVKTSDRVLTSAIYKNTGTDILLTSDDKANLFSESVTIVNDKTSPGDGVVDTDNKLLIWHVLLIITGGVLFILLTVVIIITFLHKSDNNYSLRRRNQRYGTSTREKTDSLSQNYNDKQYKSHPRIHHSNESQSFPHYIQRVAGHQLLVQEEPRSVINIRGKDNSLKYPFGDIVIKYPDEPKPDYHF